MASEEFGKQLKAIDLAPDRFQAFEAIQQKIRRLELLEQQRQRIAQTAEIRSRAAERTLPRTNSAASSITQTRPNTTADMKARAAARLAAMGGRQSTAGYQVADSQSFGSPGLPRLDPHWAIEDEVVFQPRYEDDDGALCVLDWPASAANTVGDAIRALSPRREHSPLRWLEPVIDKFERAQQSVCSMRRQRFPSNGTRAPDKRSI